MCTFFYAFISLNMRVCHLAFLYMFLLTYRLPAGVMALAQCMRSEEDEQARFEAALAVSRCGAAATVALPLLRKALHDPSR